MHYHVQIVTDLPGLARLKFAWQELESCIPENTGFFASWAYTNAYLQHHRQKDWCIIAISESESGKLEGVFPLQLINVENAGRRFRFGKPLGVSYLSYIEFCIRSQSRREILNVLLGDTLRQHIGVDAFCFWPLHERSPLYLTLLEDLAGGTAFKSLRFAGNLNELDTRSIRFEDYERSRASRTFSNARYCQRRMGREGEVRFCHAEADPEGVLVEQLCMRTGEQFKENHAYRGRTDWDVYFRALYRTLAPDGLAEMATLRLNERVISSALIFNYKQRRYLHMYAYDPEYAAFSPSKVLLVNLIEQVFRERGILCFGAGAQGYKREWVASVGELKSAFVFLNPDARSALEPILVPENMYRLFGS